MKTTMRTIRRWEGGFVRQDSHGRDVYVIRRTVGGKRITISTRCHFARAAVKELERFEADPHRYTPGGATKVPILLNAELAGDFLDHSLTELKNSHNWVRTQRCYLAWWADRLEGRDLRTLSLAEDLIPILKKTPGKGQKIKVLKALFRYLREELKQLSKTEDCTFMELRCIQSQPEQWKRDKALPLADFLKLQAHLSSKGLAWPWVRQWRWAIDVLAGTGWHVTALWRFASGGEAQAKVCIPDRGEVNVLVCPQEKSGEPLRTEVSDVVFEAGKKLLEYGSFSISRFREAVKAASIEAGLAPFTPGRMRHAVATFAVNSGQPIKEVTTAYNQKASKTTKRFYATHAVPAKLRSLL